MRIALVTDTYLPQVNGVTTVVHRIARLLAFAGHRAGVVAPRYPAGAGGGGSGGPDELRVPSVPFPPYPAVRLSLPLPRPVTRFLDAFGPDLVHVATEGPLGLVGRRYTLRRGIPLVTSFHTDFARYVRDYGVPALAPLAWRWLTWFHGPAQLVQTPGEAVRDELVGRGLTRCAIWGRGVDLSFFRPDLRDAALRRELGAGDGRPIVLHVGRLAPEKNLEVLIRALWLTRWAIGERAIFVVAGDGPSARRVRAGLPWARHLGFLDRRRLAALYASSDLGVLPSVTETCGLVALEAMASGLPVIAADAGGLRESVRPGRSGVLVAPHDIQGFALAVIALVYDPTRRAALAVGARRAAAARDTANEDQELLSQYATLIHHPDTGDVTCAA